MKRISSFHHGHPASYSLVLALTILFLAPSQCLAQWPYFIVPITVTGGAVSIRDTFGLYEGSTYCIDGQIDSLFYEEELPPDVPMIFDARFEESRPGSSCLGVGVRLNLQEFWKTDTFRLRITPPSESPYPMTVSWTKESHGAAAVITLRLIDTFGGSIVDLDMLTDSSLVITNDSLLNLVIYAYGVVGDVDEPDPFIPAHYTLEQNYPNPFNGLTTIKFTVSSGGYITLKLFDQLGRNIETLFKAFVQPGTRYVTYDASSLSSGVYFYRLESGVRALTKRFVLSK